MTAGPCASTEKCQAQVFDEKVVITLYDSEFCFPTLREQIESLGTECRRARVDVQCPKISGSALTTLVGQLDRDLGLDLESVTFSKEVFLQSSEVAEEHETSDAPQIDSNREACQQNAPIMRPATCRAPKGRRTNQIHGTLRSGRVVQFDGDITLVGDVNPGAKVIATGDVVVLGKVKGAIHAGSEGNAEAFIFALGCADAQLQVGGRTLVNFEQRATAGPAVAYVKNDSVTLEPFTGRVPR